MTGFCRFDAERLCRKTDQHREARGLGGCVRAWCGKEPQNRHRSDGDALATMNLLKAVCEAMHVSADMLLEAYPDCAGKSTATPKAKPTTKPSTSKTAKAASAKPASAKPASNAKAEKDVELFENSPEVKGAVAIKEGKPMANGKFDIQRAKDGRFFFSLYCFPLGEG